VRLTVLSRGEAERYRPAQPAACISITGSDDAPARLPFAYCAVLRLAFDDVPLAPADCPPGARACGRDEAAEIAAFVRRALAFEPAELVVHCEFGASRSAEIALGVADGLRLPDTDVARLEAERPAHHRGIRALVASVLDDAAPGAPVRRDVG
jgi:predicted protein tyrosine phosphatase